MVRGRSGLCVCCLEEVVSPRCKLGDSLIGSRGSNQTSNWVEGTRVFDAVKEVEGGELLCGVDSLSTPVSGRNVVLDHAVPNEFGEEAAEFAERCVCVDGSNQRTQWKISFRRDPGNF